MPIVAQGAPATVSLVVRNSSGDAVDPSNLSLSIRNTVTTVELGAFPVVFPGDILHDSLGHFHYDWPTGAVPIAGYTATWDAILLGAPETAIESWEVVASGSLTIGNLDFLQKPEDYDAIRGLLGVTTLDVEDANIEYLAFAPHAERLVKNRISNWSTQMTDVGQLFVLRLATVYQTACLMAESYVRGGTIGLVRPLSVGEGRDWADAAEQFCNRYNYWVNLADADDDDDSDTSSFDVDPLKVGGPTSLRVARARATGQVIEGTGRVWPWGYPPYWHEPRS